MTDIVEKERPGLTIYWLSALRIETFISVGICVLGLTAFGCVDEEPRHSQSSGSSGVKQGYPSQFGPEVSVEMGLPDGRWVGELTYTEFDSQPSLTDYSVVVRDNVYYTSSRTQAIILYTGQGTADWLGPSEELFGTCTARGNELACSSTPEQRFQVTRDLLFYEDTLVWSEFGSLEGNRYERSGVLYFDPAPGW